MRPDTRAHSSSPGISATINKGHSVALSKLSSQVVAPLSDEERPSSLCLSNVNSCSIRPPLLALLCFALAFCTIIRSTPTFARQPNRFRLRSNHPHPPKTLQHVVPPDHLSKARRTGSALRVPRAAFAKLDPVERVQLARVAQLDQVRAAHERAGVSESVLGVPGEPGGLGSQASAGEERDR